MVHGVGHPRRNVLRAEEGLPVELRVPLEHRRAHVLVKDADHQRGHHGEHDVVERLGPALVRGLPAELVVQREPEERHVERHGLVEAVEDRLAQPRIAPVPVHQEQLAQEAELGDRHVCAARRLEALEPADPDAHVRRLDHAHVVRPVADGEQDVVRAPLHQLHHQRLLERRDAAAHHRAALRGERKEHVCECVVVQHVLQAVPLDDERKLLGRRALLGALGERRVEAALQRVARVGRRRLAHHQHAHRLRDEPAGVPDVDRRLLPVAREHPDLDPRGLQRGDRLRDALLEPVLDRRGAQQLQVPLHLLRGALERLDAAVHARGRRLVPLRPGAVLVLGQLPLRDAQRAQAVPRVRLERGDRRLEARLLRAEPREQHRVGALAEERDPAVGAPHHGRHALPRRGELAHLEHLVLVRRAVHLDVHRARLARGETVPERLRAGDERRLVRRGGLERDAPLARLGDHGVAHGEQREELVAGRAERVAAAEHGGQLRPGALAAHQAAVRVALVGRCVVARRVAERDTADRRLAELHHVPREGARLVAEDVVHLAELLDEVGPAALRRRVARLVVHLEVRVDQQRLVELDKLHRDDQRDRDQAVVQDNEREDRLDKRTCAAPVVQLRHEVLCALGEGGRLDQRADRTDHREREQQDKQRDDQRVHLAVHPGALRGGRGRVAHQLGVVPGEHRQAVRPGRVPQLCAAQEQLVRPDGHRAAPGAPLEVQRAVERVQAVVRRLALEPPTQRRDARGRGEARGRGRRLPHLEVRLPVQVRRLHIRQALGLRAGQQHEVRGEKVVPLHPHHVAHTHVAPAARGPRVQLRLQHLDGARVELCVGHGTAPVLAHLLERTGQQHNAERHERRPAVRRRHVRDLLDAPNEEEEHVRVLGELLKQEPRHERDHIVLVCRHHVVAKVEHRRVRRRVVQLHHPRALHDVCAAQLPQPLQREPPRRPVLPQCVLRKQRGHRRGRGEQAARRPCRRRARAARAARARRAAGACGARARSLATRPRVQLALLVRLDHLAGPERPHVELLRELVGVVQRERVVPAHGLADRRRERRRARYARRLLGQPPVRGGAERVRLVHLVHAVQRQLAAKRIKLVRIAQHMYGLLAHPAAAGRGPRPAEQRLDVVHPRWPVGKWRERGASVFLR